MTVQKRYRLWIDSHGKPLYVEVNGVDFRPDEIEFIRRHIRRDEVVERITVVRVLA